MVDKNQPIIPPSQAPEVVPAITPRVNGAAKNFSITDSIAAGWNLFWQRPGYFVGLLLIPSLISFLLGIVIRVFFGILFGFGNDQQEILMLIKLLGMLLNSVVTAVFTIGMLRGYIESVQGLKPELKEMFQPRGLIIKFIAVSILTNLIIVVGYFLFIIPGIIFTLMFAFSTYTLIDEKRGVVESIKRSQDLTNSVKLKLLVFFMATVIVNIIGFLILGVGILVTSSVTSLASVYVYESLKKQTV